MRPNSASADNSATKRRTGLGEQIGVALVADWVVALDEWLAL
jgi:hypothetical protein